MNFEKQHASQDSTSLMQVALLEKHPDWIDTHAKEFRNYIHNTQGLLICLNKMQVLL